MLIIILIGLLVLVVTIGLGYWNYVLGRHNQANLVGAIIPLGYFIVRAISAVTTQQTTRGMVISLAGSLLIGLVYYGLYILGKHRVNKIEKSKK